LGQIENYEHNKGWWFYIELLIAEQKSQMPETYRSYCDSFAKFLAETDSPKKRKESLIIHGTR
jgi:hypothetical protein